MGRLTSVVSNSSLNEIKLVESRIPSTRGSLADWSHSWQAANGRTAGHPIIRMRGFSVAGSSARTSLLGPEGDDDPG
jgi:hypothetical protein